MCVGFISPDLRLHTKLSKCRMNGSKNLRTEKKLGTESFFFFFCIGKFIFLFFHDTRIEYFMMKLNILGDCLILR